MEYKVSEYRLMWHRMGTFGDMSSHKVIGSYQSWDQANADLNTMKAIQPEYAFTDRYYISNHMARITQ